MEGRGYWRRGRSVQRSTARLLRRLVCVCEELREDVVPQHHPALSLQCTAPLDTHTAKMTILRSWAGLGGPGQAWLGTTPSQGVPLAEGEASRKQVLIKVALKLPVVQREAMGS